MDESTKLLEPKKSKGVKLTPHFCPVCGVDTIEAECMQDAKTEEQSIWYKCQCGVIFQDHFPTSQEVYDDKYIALLAETKEARERYEYMVRLYAPIVEECTYGRMMLEVGFCVPFTYKAMEERGWLTWGIDINPALTGKGNIYKGDFLTYDFSLSNDAVKAATGEEKIERKFDLIWMGHMLEHVENPIAVLNKAYDLLDPKGCLVISTPDIDFLTKTTVHGWPYFVGKEHYIMWSERALVRELERIGFKIVMKRRNFSARFVAHYDLHIIAQKNYY